MARSRSRAWREEEAASEGRSTVTSARPLASCVPLSKISAVRQRLLGSVVLSGFARRVEGVEQRNRFLSPTASQRHSKHWSGCRLHRVPRMNHIACEFTFPYSVSYVLIRE